MSPSEEIYTRVISKSHPQQMMPGCDIPQPKRKANHQPLEKKRSRETVDALTVGAFGREAVRR